MDSGNRKLEQLIYVQPGHLIRRAHQIAWNAFMEETKRYDVTPVQYAALVAIVDHPGIEAVRVAHLVSLDRATIGNVLDRMERRGLIQRSTKESDKRSKHTYVTSSGKRLMNTVSGALPTIGERILGRLPKKDRQLLMGLLSRLVGIGGTTPDAPRRKKRREQQGP